MLKRKRIRKPDRQEIRAMKDEMRRTRTTEQLFQYFGHDVVKGDVCYMFSAPYPCRIKDIIPSPGFSVTMPAKMVLDEDDVIVFYAEEDADMYTITLIVEKT